MAFPKLTMIEGARFFATFMIITGHALTFAEVDANNLDDSMALFLERLEYLDPAEQKVVSFWFILAGFTMTWASVTRDMDDSVERMNFWKRRIAAIYPDLVISSAIMFLAAFLFYCQCDWRFWMLNLFSFTLIPSFLPGWTLFNGPVWFIMVYGALVVVFPFLLGPTKTIFRNTSVFIFCFFLGLLWLVSLLPSVFVPFDNTPMHARVLIANPGLFWDMTQNPVFHIAEFLIGMALAIKLHEDFQSLDAKSDKSKSQLLIPLGIAPYAIILAAIFSLAFCLVRAFMWSPTSVRSSIDEMYPTLLAPCHIVIIYGLVALELSRSKENPDVEADTIGAGKVLWQVLSWRPIVTAASWGLPTFLFQYPVIVSMGLLAQLVGLGTFTTYCLPSDTWGTKHVYPITTLFNLSSYLIAVPLNVIASFAVGWLMSRDGPLGQHVHSAVSTLLNGPRREDERA